MAPSPRLLGCSGDRETWTGPSRPPVSSIGRFSSSPPDFLTPWFRADSNEAADFSSPLASLAALLRWVSLDEAADSSPPLASLAAVRSSCSFCVGAVGFSFPLVVATGRPPSLDDSDDGAGPSPERCGL